MEDFGKISPFFKNKKVLITGGAGMLGSNLANKLVSVGSKVTLLDAFLPLYGGRLFNIKEIKNLVVLKKGDILDEKLIQKLVKGKDLIFSFAAQADYLKSNEMPFRDLDINARGQLMLLRACLRHNKKAKIFFSSSRLIYGRIISNPVNENHPTNPLNHYALHKFLADEYFKFYNRLYDLDTVVFRISNPFGPRQQVKHSHYSIVGWFIKLAMENKTIDIFGNGSQLRDYIFIEDLVSAFLYAACDAKTSGEVFNIGSGKGTKFIDMAKTIVNVIGKGRVKHIPWPKGYEKNETGDYVADITKIKKIGWKPKLSFEEAVRKTYEYYKKYARYYF